MLVFQSIDSIIKIWHRRDNFLCIDCSGSMNFSIVLSIKTGVRRTFHWHYPSQHRSENGRRPGRSPGQIQGHQNWLVGGWRVNQARADRFRWPEAWKGHLMRLLRDWSCLFVQRSLRPFKWIERMKSKWSIKSSPVDWAFNGDQFKINANCTSIHQNKIWWGRITYQCTIVMALFMID